MTDDELDTEMVESRRELMNLRFRVATMQLANVYEIKKTKKRIARIGTLMRQREISRTS